MPLSIPFDKKDTRRDTRRCGCGEANLFPERVNIEKFFFSMTNILDDIIDKSGIIDDVSLYTIEAYVSWTDTVVEITYPSKNPAWLKRSDCGSHSQHRWGLYNDQLQECVQAVVMHNSCLKATFNKEEICRNCEFRNVWRKTCTTPENIFYIIALSDVKECENLFNPLIISHKQVASEDLDSYNKTVPKGAFQVKQVRSNQKKRMQINRLEKNIEESVKASNQMKEKHYSAATCLMRCAQQTLIQNQERLMLEQKNAIEQENQLSEAELIYQKQKLKEQRLEAENIQQIDKKTDYDYTNTRKRKLDDLMS